MDPIIDKIDRYLDGKMDAAEQAAFEKEVSANPGLQQQIYVQKNLRAGIGRAGMKSAINKSFKQQSLKSKVYKWGIATATIAVVGTAVYFGAQKYSSAAEAGPQITYELPTLNEDGKPEWANADKNLPTQLFQINPNKDTILETQSGIVFAIPAGAFT